MRTRAGMLVGRRAAGGHWIAGLLVAALTIGAGLGPTALARASEGAASPAAAPSYAVDTVTVPPATLAAGRTPGQFGVTHAGATSYQIPLWTPPGVGDAEPGLALVYNSRAGNGILGPGWTLAGLSSISRCARTVAQDGAVQGVTNSLADRFCLDGAQLKLVSGTYGIAGSVYGTELESFARIVAEGVAGEGPLSFTVWQKNGLVYEYGATADSRAQAGSAPTVRTWALSRMRDRAGNAVSFSYVNDAQAGAYGDGTQRIASILYPTTATGAGPFYEVRFSYAARPENDVPTGYQAGNLVREPYTLQRIEIGTPGSTSYTKRYNLGYDTSAVTGRMRLASVQECWTKSCLRETTIGYQAGAAGWGAARDLGFNAAPDFPVYVADFDGDGKSDMLYPVGAGSGKWTWRISRAALPSTPVNTGFITTSSTSKIVIGDFVGLGRPQFLVQQAGAWTLAGFNGTNFATAPTGLAASGEYASADIDGDGLADLVGVANSVTVFARRNLTNPTPGVFAAQFANTTLTVWTIPDTRDHSDWNNPRIADLDGDGRADIVVLTKNLRDRNVRLFATPFVSQGFGAAPRRGQEKEIFIASQSTTGDWNADGCTDLLQVHHVYLSDCAGAFITVATGATASTGDGAHAVLPVDWDSDGRTDVLYIDLTTRQWFVVPSTGAGAATPRTTGVPAPSASAWFIHDSDGDGQVDLGARMSDNRLWHRSHAAVGSPPDLATSFTDGFGISHTPSYVSIARSNHVRQWAAVFPEADFQAPLYVVSKFDASDGSGGTYRNSFEYQGARRHLQGRGFEGFDTQRIVDTRNGLVTVDTVARTFPYTGLHTGRTVFQPDGVTLAASATFTWAQRLSGGVGSEQRIFLHLGEARQRSHELSGVSKGALIAETVTTYSYGDGYGEPTSITSTVTDRHPTSPFVNNAWTSTATLSYSHDPSDNWCLALPASRIVTRTAPGQSDVTRTTTYSADMRACRVTQTIAEPNLPALKVVSAYGYDPCGNVNLVSVVGSNPDGTAMPARRVTLGYGARCQLPETITNALGQTAAYEYRYDFGVLTRAADPNGLATTWSHDGFGRAVLEVRPDNTSTAWSFQSCDAGPCAGDPNYRFVVYETERGTDSVAVHSAQAGYDGLERPRSNQFQRAGGVWTRVDYGYDAAGRRVYESRPYSSTPNGHTQRTFDAFGRLLSSRDNDGAGAPVRIYGFGYAGHTSTATDPLGRTRTFVRDVTGALRRVIDPAPGGTTRYDYGAFGHLVRIEDPIGAVSTGIYGPRGALTRWNDADAGAWTYARNSLDELVGWTDAKGQSFAAQYDALGRLTARVEPEGTSTFKWGDAPARHNVGRLESMTGLGYGEAREYDVAGRLAMRTIVTDQAYQYEYAYNSIGALDTVTYPASPVPAGQAESRLRIRYGYSFGDVSSVDDVTQAAARPLWRLDQSNDYGQPSVETLGASASTIRSTYEPATGRLVGIQTGPTANPLQHQNLVYAWDAANNLTQRRDANQNLTETFQLDALDRVTGSALNGVPNLDVRYDASGNVRYKLDVGTYEYGLPARPHAATTAGVDALGYDANGNVTLRNGVPQAWSSFNLPTRLDGNGYRSDLAYGPDHQRWRQVATYLNGTETTHYVGNLLEKVQASSTGMTYWRHYVPTPGGTTVVVSRNSNGSSSTTFALSDHLGSSDRLLDVGAGTVVKTSFAAFGARRGSDWTATTSPDWAGIGNTTRHGFTGHESLDGVGLVHMGGRVYDPRLGRFLSVDPVIADTAESQTVNPYSYVSNRPLSATDPTGFVVAEAAACKVVCTTFLTTVGKMFAGLLHFGGGTVWLPPATSMPGQSAQTTQQWCWPGSYSINCAGMVLYAGAPYMGEGGPATSTWATVTAADPYALENLDQFFIDLGINAVRETILSPFISLNDARKATIRGDYVGAAVLSTTTICEAAKPCAGAGKLAKIVTSAARSGVDGLPKILARVVAGNRKLGTLGRPDAPDVFVVDADDIAGLDAKQLAERLTIPDSETFTVIRFPTPDTGLASPILRDNPGFLPGGLTRGGAREYVIPNGPVPADAAIELIK